MTNNLKYRRMFFQIIIFIFLSLLLLQLVLAVINHLSKPNLDTHPNSITYQIDESSKPINHLWTQHNIYSSNSLKGGVLIDSIDGNIYFLFSTGQ